MELQETRLQEVGDKGERTGSEAPPTPQQIGGVDGPGRTDWRPLVTPQRQERVEGIEERTGDNSKNSPQPRRLERPQRTL